jgi:geranylgeranyl diphosphate synthase type I
VYREEKMVKPVDFKSFSNKHVPEIDTSIASFFSSIETVDYTKQMYESLNEFCLRPGKRIRPLLFLLSLEGYGISLSDTYYELASLIEIMHSYLLIHDDIIDESPERRGGKSLHIKLADDYDKSHARAGEFGALIAGDVLVFDVYNSLIEKLHENKISTAFLKIFSECYLYTCRGQYLDLYFSYNGNAEDKQTPFEISRLKTSFYTMIYPFLMGASLAGALDETTHDDIVSVFLPLGIAFQLRDDYIGTFSSSTASGKSDSSDLVHSKKTLLISLALESMNGVDKEEFMTIFEKQKKEEDEIFRLKEILNFYNVESLIERRLADYRDEFNNYSGKLRITKESYSVLCDIAKKISSLPGKETKNENL